MEKMNKQLDFWLKHRELFYLLIDLIFGIFLWLTTPIMEKIIFSPTEPLFNYSIQSLFIFLWIGFIFSIYLYKTIEKKM